MNYIRPACMKWIARKSTNQIHSKWKVNENLVWASAGRNGLI
jgi:hypothetical protein